MSYLYDILYFPWLLDQVCFHSNNQRYYLATGKELMRINGTTKSFVASHLAESIAGAMTIRAFGEEDRHFSKTLDFIDINASPFFYNFTANEWLIQRLEILCAIVLSSSALALTSLHTSASKSGRCFSSQIYYCFSLVYTAQLHLNLLVCLYIPNYQFSKMKSQIRSATSTI